MGRGGRAGEVAGGQPVLAGHAGRPQCRRAGQSGRSSFRKAQPGPGPGHGLDQQEKIGRAAARYRRHRIQQGFLFNPEGLAHGTEQLFGLLALCRADLWTGIQATDAGAEQGRGIGHAADDGPG